MAARSKSMVGLWMGDCVWQFVVPLEKRLSHEFVSSHNKSFLNVLK